VTIEGTTHALERPFLVLATQNPVEYEGTYPLPEAQRDRFLVHVAIGYPSADEERAMLRLRRRGLTPAALDDVQPVASADDLRAARAEVDATEITEEVVGYVVAVVRRTRELPSVALGASPRAAVHLLGAAKAAARLAGRAYVTPDDVSRMAAPVLRHRLVLTPEAELERATPAGAIRTALEDVPVPRSTRHDARPPRGHRPRSHLAGGAAPARRARRARGAGARRRRRGGRHSGQA